MVFDHAADNLKSRPMPKNKLVSLDWKIPMDSKVRKRLLKIGKLDPTAWAAVRILTTCSVGYRKEQREDPNYAWLLGNAKAAKGLGYKSVAAFEANRDKKAAKTLAGLARYLCDVVYAGNALAFRKIAECVEFTKTHGLSTWADPLGQQIEDYCISNWLKNPKVDYDDFRKKFIFNIEQFIEATKDCPADHKTIAKRVRVIGFLMNKGRPRGVKNKKR